LSNFFVDGFPELAYFHFSETQEMDAKIKVAEAMREYARGLQISEDPDVVIAAAEWEKVCIEKLDQLQKQQRRIEARRAA